MPTTIPEIAALHAPATWQVVDFISDLHLQASEPATAQIWQQYMGQTVADAVFILGDLFEVWVGDDTLGAADAEAAFDTQCVQTLHAAAQQRAIYLLHGNRDFLLGPDFAQACGLTLLADPTALHAHERVWLLSHGDALCLDDTDYLQFRAQVRSPAWQQGFLARSLSERRAIARGLRSESEARKTRGEAYADVDTIAARQWLQAAGANTLIHGHTHRPAEHDLGNSLRRTVLSDWEADTTPPRAEVLRLDLQTGQMRRLAVAQTS